jgi:hypothetical protein
MKLLLHNKNVQKHGKCVQERVRPAPYNAFIAATLRLEAKPLDNVATECARCT